MVSIGKTDTDSTVSTASIGFKKVLVVRYPLNDAILSAHAIVKAFQKTNRIDIVNTVFLTDGASNYSYYNRDYDMRANIAWNETWIFTNEVTKKSIRLTQSGTSRLGINTTLRHF